MVSGLLYDAYLKYLVNSVPKPDTLAVSDFYEKNKYDKYMEEEKITLREIRVPNKAAAEDLLALLDTGADFALLAKQNSSVNPDGGGLLGPFQRNANKLLFDAASLLNEEDISPVLSSSKNSFSIIKLVNHISAVPVRLDRVYVQIESLLIKEGRIEAKAMGIDGLLNLYTVVKNAELLF